MREIPNVKLLVNKSEQLRTSEREFQTNMVQKTLAKLVNTKICPCCYEPLVLMINPFHFSVKSLKGNLSWKDTMK